MLRGRSVALFLLGCLIILANAQIVLCMTSAPVVYVAGDGSGDFNCDGKDDHVQINQALKFVAENPEYTTVHLKGPFTYVIDDSLLIGSNTILEGDPDAVVKLVDHAGWAVAKPLIRQISGSGNSNITIRGFEVNGNHDKNTEVARGKNYYNVIYFTNCKNVTAYDMYMHDGHGDGLRIKNGENVQFYNNTIYKLGHDGLYAIECTDVEAWNNTITCRTNSGLRIWNSNKVDFHDNKIDSFYHWSAGSAGIQIGKSAGIMDDVEIHDNTINNTYGPGIWLFNYDSSSNKDEARNVHIYHNIFYGTGTNPSIDWVGGIVTSGFYDTLIENNVFDGVYHAAIVIMYPTGNSTDISPKGTGYTTTVRNNIIANTLPRTKDPAGTGYGVINYLPKTHTLVLENNCLYNNTAGDYKNAESTSDIHLNPLFADLKKHDYHLRSTAGRRDGNEWVKDGTDSPCIDAGYLSSEYSGEPEDNGNRINIGRYGNTTSASLSGPEAVTDSGAANSGVAESGDSRVTKMYDNRLREISPEDVFQSKSYLDLGNRPGAGSYREMMWFDLKGYGDPDKISSVTLSLYWYYPNVSRPEDTVVEIYRPADSWNPEYVSWNKKEKGIAWKNAGGDWFDKKGVSQGSTPYATFTIKNSTLPESRYYELDVTDLVKEYVSSKHENTGFLIKTRYENSDYVAFYSLDCGKEELEPKLNIVYG